MTTTNVEKLLDELIYLEKVKEELSAYEYEARKRQLENQLRNGRY